jgi:hypothetical protein
MYFLGYFPFLGILTAEETSLFLAYSDLKVPATSFFPNSKTVTSPTLLTQQICSDVKKNYSDPEPIQSISDYNPVFPLQTISV